MCTITLLLSSMHFRFESKNVFFNVYTTIFPESLVLRDFQE